MTVSATATFAFIIGLSHENAIHIARNVFPRHTTCNLFYTYIHTYMHTVCEQSAGLIMLKQVVCI